MEHGREGRMSRNLLRRLTLLGALVFASAGCETLTRGVVAVDEALYEIVPTHPVTGRPMANLVTEEREIETVFRIPKYLKLVLDRP